MSIGRCEQEAESLATQACLSGNAHSCLQKQHGSIIPFLLLELSVTQKLVLPEAPAVFWAGIQQFLYFITQNLHKPSIEGRSDT